MIGEPANTILICEGFATGATLHEATDHAVAVAFNAGNLESVAKALRARYPDICLIICGDDDAATVGNPGLKKATDAARSVGAVLALPDFGAHRPGKASDFNDLAAHAGIDTVRRQIQRLRAPEWPAPQPIFSSTDAEPYPLDALPDSVRFAVEEVQGFVHAPAAMVAACALSALSLASQAHVDVQRADKLHGPSSLFMLTIADSGERKSTCDGFFSKAIRDYETEQAEIAKPLIQEHRAKSGAWEAKLAGIKDTIRQLSKTGKATREAEASLRDLEFNQPIPPRVPRLIYADATPEALAHGLAKQWPSGGVMSAEAGIVLGSHAMGKDSVMRNLAMLNTLWDGTALTIDRRTSESFTVHGARLSMGLQVQSATLRDFFAKSGSLARGSGFMARFLISWPDSTQGSRAFSEAPTNWPHLAAFNRRLSETLNRPAPMTDDGALKPTMMTFSPEAKSLWIEFHDAIEVDLSVGRELFDVRDCASKTADNAARLAALFHVFASGVGAISATAFESASRIAAWHLGESRRFFGELALPTELTDATRLDRWITDYCSRERTNAVGKNHTRQHGPLRHGAALDAAIRELVDLDRVRLLKDGKRITIEINPALIERGHESRS